MKFKQLASLLTWLVPDVTRAVGLMTSQRAGASQAL